MPEGPGAKVEGENVHAQGLIISSEGRRFIGKGLKQACLVGDLSPYGCKSGQSCCILGLGFKV